MGRFQAVNGHLVLSASRFFQFFTGAGCQVKGITHDGKGYAGLMQQLRERPEIGMKERIPSGNAERWLHIEPVTESQAFVQDPDEIGGRNGFRLFLPVFPVDIAMGTPLITGIGNMPLEGEPGPDVRSGFFFFSHDVFHIVPFA